jgi:hypothetical protein
MPGAASQSRPEFWRSLPASLLLAFGSRVPKQIQKSPWFVCGVRCFFVHSSPHPSSLPSLLACITGKKKINLDWPALTAASITGQQPICIKRNSGLQGTTSLNLGRDIGRLKERRMEKTTREILTVKELAERWKLNPYWIYHHIRELPHFKVGSLVRFDAQEIEEHFQTSKKRGNGFRSAIGGHGSLI